MSSRIIKLDAVEDVDLARLAAFVDGEGSIALYRNNKKSAGCSYALELSVSNTDIRLVQWIKETFGFGFVRTNIKPQRWRTLYQWECYSRQAEEVLRAIYPFLIIKREQADLVFDFLKLVMPVGTNRISEENCKQRLTLVHRLRSMHKGGSREDLQLSDTERCGGTGTPVAPNTLAPRSQVEAVVGGQSGR